MNPNPKCEVCGSQGFNQSVTGQGCTFCDGTEGGNPPATPATPDQHRIAELESKLAKAEAELEKVKDSRATMALQNASLLTDLDQVILDREAAEARVKAVTAEGIELVKKALGCLVVWRCVVCRHDLYEMPISPSGPCPKCSKSSHFHGLFSDDREGLVALLRAADAAKEASHESELQQPADDRGEEEKS